MLSKQRCHSVSQCQLYLNYPQEISSEYLSERVPNTVMPNLPFTIAQTSNTVRTLRSRYISSHNEGFCLSRVFPIGSVCWWCHRETELWLNPVKSVIKGAEPTDTHYTFCPACTFWWDFVLLDLLLDLPTHFVCVSLHLHKPLLMKLMREVWLVI